MAPEDRHLYQHIEALTKVVCEHAFKRESKEKKLLAYLAKNWSRNEELNTTKLTEKAIGVELFKQESDWNPSDPGSASIVRVTLSRIRKDLRHFFRYTSEGRKSGQRLELPEGSPYVLKVARNTLELDPVERFWDAHIINGTSRLIIYTEPLFLWDAKNRSFVRYLDVNSDSDDPDEVRRKLVEKFGKRHRAMRMTPCFHYQASGEINALRALQGWFEQNDVKSEVKLSRECNDDAGSNHNLVVLGNSRTNRFLRRLQAHNDMILSGDRIELRDPDQSKGERHLYRDTPYSLKKEDDECIYCVVTRRPIVHSKTVATLIGSNHGRALEKAASYLTSPKSMEILFQKIGILASEPLPEYFQILLKVEGPGFDTNLGDAEIVTVRSQLLKNAKARSAKAGTR